MYIKGMVGGGSNQFFLSDSGDPNKLALDTLWDVDLLEACFRAFKIT